MTTSLHEKLKTVQDAINYEIDQHYVNSKGKKTTFSNFIIQSAKSLSSFLDDKEELKTLISLFYSYPVQDLSGRMHAVHRAQEILKTMSEKAKTVEVPHRGASKSFEKNLRKIDVQYVKGVGPRMSVVLSRLGIFSAHDLMTYYPKTYFDYKSIVPIKDLKLEDTATVCGTVKSIKSFSPPRRKHLTILTLVVQDETGRINITRFVAGRMGKIIQSQYKKQYPVGTKVFCSGTVAFDKFARAFALANAAVEVIGDEKSNLNTRRIVPVYALTEGLSQEYLRKVISSAFAIYGELIEETLPKRLIHEEKLLDLRTSLTQIHFPDSEELCALARSRIVFEEFFMMQLELAFRRAIADKNRKGLALKEHKDSLVTKLIKSLPFKLTGAQERVLKEIKQDLMSSKPMHRLLQGDVGSGKTIVSLIALLFAIENNYQTALMAPTEILVYQHARKFQEYLSPLGIEVVVLTGSIPAKMKKEIYGKLQRGEMKIVVGTHALIQDDVQFSNLGLVVIDEQHRFGVKQRDALLQKGKNVERLFMTATPIPRTLALALHGDLELSEIDELPAGRIPIKTYVVQPSRRQKAFDLILGEVAKGRQAYIVFPLIDESEALSAKAATIEFEELSKTVFKNIKLGLMHGELPSAEKDNVMKDFVNNEINVLITTTVIEVGVDVSNATVMMIENSERFGLSQLHQLRGRVGRGNDQAYCLLAAGTYSEDLARRLSIMTKTNNGFIISQEDLKIRGPGEFLGTRQSGLPDLKLADLVNDSSVLETAKKRAVQIIKEDPGFDNCPELKKLINKREETYIQAG